MEAIVNQKELIKRAKELVQLIENTDMANELIAKLQSIDNTIEARQRMIYHYNHKNEIMFTSMVSGVNGDLPIQQHITHQFHQSQAWMGDSANIAILVRSGGVPIFRAQLNTEPSPIESELASKKEYLFEMALQHMFRVAVSTVIQDEYQANAYFVYNRYA